MDRDHNENERLDEHGPVRGTDEPMAEYDDDADEEPAARRPWIRNAVMVLLVAALIVNILAFWPQIYNMRTLPLLFKSRELSAREDVQNYKKAVVLVVTDKGSGTGFHISGGYIVTSHHVIEGAAYAIVEFPESGARFAAEAARSDPELDIAVLRAEGGADRQPYIEIEREHDWEPGASVYVIGNPLYLKQIAGEGQVLGMMPVQGRRRPVLAVDAPVHKGNSGSPVINEHGRAIAVIYATSEIMRQDGAVQVGLAVPLRDADGLLRDLLPVDKS
jgi:Trypsin-like serine proteases, typically periplasmic, contain C-terminal PDZ domain